jgi:hypothetical protein
MTLIVFGVTTQQILAVELTMYLHSNKINFNLRTSYAFAKVLQLSASIVNSHNGVEGRSDVPFQVPIQIGN